VSPTVTASILAYQDADSIGDCIRSVLALDLDGELDVQVREQGQDDEQFRAIESAGRSIDDRRSFNVARGENVGFARGHNEAIRSSQSDFVLLVNADARLDPKFLTEALPEFADPSVGSVQGKLLTPKDDASGGNFIDTTGFLATRRRLFLPRGQGEDDVGQYEARELIFGADGAVALYRRSALEDVAVPRSFNPPGLDGDGVEYLDETYFIYKCDLDLAWRLQLRGWSCAYVPTAIAKHNRTLRRGQGRTARELLRQRRSAPAWTRALSFCNHRLTLIKNETSRQLAKDAFPWLGAEASAWVVAVGLERLGSAVTRLGRLARYARRKRHWIQSHRDPTTNPYALFVN
jgi:GT2 family glycosyltransferase